MKYLLASLAIVLSISCSSGSAENSAPKDGLTVNFQAATSKGKLYLKERIGGHLFKIDSTTSSDKKTFHLATAGLPTGYYAISFDDKNEVEFIISGEEKMTFSFPGNALGYNNANAGNSVQNVALWKYKIFEKNTQDNIDPIKAEQVKNKRNRPLVNELKVKIDKLVEEKRNYAKTLAAELPGTYFAKTAVAAVPAQPQPANVYFNDIDFADASLIRSPVYPERVMDYVHLHTGYKEPGFRKLVGDVMKRAETNEEVKAFLVRHLLEMFDEKGPPVMFQYMAETYLLADGCSDVDVSEMIRNKAEAYKQLQVGSIAPDLTLKNTADQDVKISSEVARSNYTILFFWYADCSYCHGQIPDLLRIYNTYKSKGLEVIGISIDTEKGKWISGIKAKNMPWLHLSDLKGWKSTAIQTYKIHKTPGYYLLDKNMKIVSKPTHVRAIESQLKHLF